MRVSGLNAGAIQLRRRQRQLIALRRRTLFPWALHVEAVALAPGAGERAIDVNIDAQIGALRADLVGRHHVIHQCLNEGCFIVIEKCISGGFRGGGSCGSRDLLRLRAFNRSHCGRAAGRRGAANDGTFQKITTIKF